MVANPLADPRFWPTVQVVGGLLAVILILVLLVERRPWRDLVVRPLFRRWRVWLVIATVYSLAVLAGPLPATLLVVVLTLQSLREYSGLVKLSPAYARTLLLAGALAGPTAFLSAEAFFLLPPLLLALATLQPILGGDLRAGMSQLVQAVFGWGYLAWLLGLMVVLHRHVDGGSSLLLVVGLAVALSDVGAFTLGRLLGRHPLAPALSPNKTWEGVAGNLLGAVAGVELMAFAWPVFLTPLLAFGLGLLIGVGALWGDLVESAIKRAAGAKDAGDWLPGFGGLLDRIDSFIIVLPLVFYTTLAARALSGV